MKKKAISVLLAGLIIGMLPSQAFAYTAKQKAAIKPVKTFLSGAKTYNIRTMERQFYKKPSGMFFKAKKYTGNYVRYYNKKMLSYSIDSVRVKGSRATVTAYVMYPDAYEAFYRALDKNYFYLMDHLKTSDLAADKKFIGYTKHYAKKYKITPDVKRVTFYVKKRGRYWKISKKTKAITDVINANYETAFIDYYGY